MFPTARYDIVANRFAPHVDYLDFRGFDFTDAVLLMQVRDRKNGGMLREEIVPTVEVTTVGGLPNSRVTWTIIESEMEIMPVDPGDPDADVALVYDLAITPDGGLKFIAAEGSFTVKAGVTE